MNSGDGLSDETAKINHPFPFDFIYKLRLRSKYIRNYRLQIPSEFNYLPRFMTGDKFPWWKVFKMSLGRMGWARMEAKKNR